MIKINLGLENAALYQGCQITEVGGRLTLSTPVLEAVNIVGRNAQEILDALDAKDRGEIELTGPMAVWSYLIVFHIFLHKVGKIYYCDGRSEKVLIAQH